MCILIPQKLSQVGWSLWLSLTCPHLRQAILVVVLVLLVGMAVATQSRSLANHQVCKV